MYGKIKNVDIRTRIANAEDENQGPSYLEDGKKKAKK